MILYVASAVIFIFVALNLFLKSSASIYLKAAGCLLIFLISLKYEIYQFCGGAFFAPQLPRIVLLALEALYGALIILFFLLLLWDIYLVGNWILGRAGLPVPERLPAGYIKTGLVLIALGLGIWGTWQAVKVPEVRQVNVAIANLPSGLEGFGIVQLTDIHIGPILKKNWLEEVVQKANALEPDIIALTGDYVDGYVDEIAGELQPLENLRAKYGVFGVTGNHEYYWNMPQWQKVLQNLGIDMLDNRHRALNIGDETLVVAGIPDLAATRFGFAGPNLEVALQDAPDCVRLLLTHQPKHGESYASNVDLQLTGHTHGGLMFFLQPLIARFNSGFVSGLYALQGKNLYVSPGTGLWNGFSCRIGVPAEITHIILHRK